MKVTAGKVAGFVARPPAGVAVFLVFGPDQGAVRDHAKTLIGQAARADDPFSVVELSGPDLAKDPARLADEARSVGFFGGTPVISVRDATDAVAGALKPAVEAAGWGTRIVVEAGDLSARSSLRKLVEAADAAAAIGCYPPDAMAMAELVRHRLQAAGKRVDADAEHALAAALPPDRGVALNEIDKLILYLGSDDRLTLEMVAAAIGDAGERSIDDLAMAAGGGDLAAADGAYQRLIADGVSVVAIARGLQRHFNRLYQAANRVAAGTGADQAIKELRPPVFFKHAPAFRRQLGTWRPERLERALALLTEAEALTKRTGMPDRALLHRVVLQVARLGAGR